ncbi:hypothetical protein JCM19233_6155 [Vibrio astriarenae]|nr:hypothetical protein JCM19233_6155 [Vibrio sp. C7]
MMTKIYVIDLGHPKVEIIEECSIKFNGEPLIDGGFDYDELGVVALAEDEPQSEHYVGVEGFNSRYSDYPTPQQRDYYISILGELEAVNMQLDGEAYKVIETEISI